MTAIERGFCVPPSHPALAGHFPGNPVVPGVLLLDCVVLLIEAATGTRVEGLRQIKFLSAVRPGEQVELQCEVQRELPCEPHALHARFRAVTHREGRAVAVATGTVSLRGAERPSA